MLTELLVDRAECVVDLYEGGQNLVRVGSCGAGLEEGARAIEEIGQGASVYLRGGPSAADQRHGDAPSRADLALVCVRILQQRDQAHGETIPARSEGREKRGRTWSLMRVSPGTRPDTDPVKVGDQRAFSRRIREFGQIHIGINGLEIM